MREGEAALDASRRLLLTTWQRGGAGSVRSVEYLADGLKARGHHVWVACPADGPLGDRLRRRGVSLVDFEFGRGWSPLSAWRLARLVGELDVDLLDAQESRDRKAAILARYVFGTRNRLVITRRQQTSTFFLENRLYAAAADAIIAISDGVKRSLVRAGTPPGRIRVVHTGLAPYRLRAPVPDPAVDGLRNELRLDDALPVIGVVARRKDQETLLRALAVLGRPANVVFLGIDQEPALERLQGGLHPDTRVRYAGFRSDVAEFFGLFDVKVLPTIREGLSQALLEAMAAGVPVIAAAAGGVPELVRDGENGLLYEPGDAEALAARLRELLGDPALRRRLASAGRAAVRGPFSSEAYVRRTEAVYREVLAGAPGRPEPAPVR